MAIVGIVLVAALLVGSALYIMGAVNKTKRLGVVTTSPTLPRQQQPILTEEEREVTAVDTGSPETDIAELERELSTLQ